MLPFNKKSLIFIILLTVTIGAAGAYAYAEQVKIRSESLSLFGKENAKVLYVESEETRKHHVKSLNFNVLKTTTTIHDEDNYQKKLFLSPNRTYVAVTVQPNEGYVGTYIIDTEGKQLTDIHPGSFVSWAPDSNKVLLFVSNVSNGDRKIYYLGINNTHTDSGLPNGSINADISPQDGSIVYSLTERGTDKSNLFIRDAQGNDSRLVSGGDAIIAWTRWSPGGTHIAFLKGDLKLSPESMRIETINADGTERRQISDVSWSYPPVWSPASPARLLFANNGRTKILEYDVGEHSLSTVADARSYHPTYSEDGETVVFSGGREVWAMRNNAATKLTDDDHPKQYPIIP